MSSDSADTSVRPSKLLSYLQLFRAPNVFTAIADVAMGFLFVYGSFEPLVGFLCLALASCLLYTAGMVLNDVYDYAVDLEERPFRPLPSGRISRAWASLLGYALLVGGVAFGWLAAAASGDVAEPIWRSGVIASGLAVCVVAYDALLKKTVLGPFAMGGCRFLNVLLGMSLGANGDLPVLNLDTAHLLVAGGIGLYIAGVTWFARTEARASRRGLLVFGMLFMAAGITGLAVVPQYAAIDIPYLLPNPTFVWPAVLFLLAFPILRRSLFAVFDPSPERVQTTVKFCIFSLIVLDAAVSLLVAGYLAVAVLSLLLPTMLLGKWVYST